jgi:hypothetical protein
MAEERDWEAVRRDPVAEEHRPGWVPYPERDRAMEEANPSWCLLHDCWQMDCRGKHRVSA